MSFVMLGVPQKFYLINPSNLAKTEKTHGSITPEQRDKEIKPVQIPYLFKAMFKFSPNAQSNAQYTGGGGGG